MTDAAVVTKRGAAARVLCGSLWEVPWAEIETHPMARVIYDSGEIELCWVEEEPGSLVIFLEVDPDE